MLEPQQREQVLIQFAKSGELADARLLSTTEVAKAQAEGRLGEVVLAALEGALVTAGRRVLLRIAICENFPIAPPYVSLCHPEKLGPLPHIEGDGRICYADRQGILLDQDYPLDILFEAFRLAIQTLNEGLLGDNSQDFVRELPSYIVQHLKFITCPCYVTADDNLRSIILSTRGPKQRLIYIADDEGTVRAFFNGQRFRRTRVDAGLYLPLLPSAAQEVTDPRLFTDAAWLRELIRRHLSAENHLRLRTTKPFGRPDPVVVIKIPRSDGGVSLIGARFRQVKDGHPLLDDSGDAAVTPIILQRRSRDALVPRGGSNISLADKHVILVGCGAVGGHLALALAQAGIGRLTLIDPDILEASNTFRHVLGHHGMGEPKVQALRWELERKVPFIRVAVIQADIETVLKLKQVFLRQSDLLIMATGEPTLSLYINRYLYKDGAAPSVIFTWLEPHSIGGHAILTQPNKRSRDVHGCLQCLYVRKPPDYELFNTASFAEGGQRFSKDLAGCGSLYTPYSGLDGIRTAELACRLAVRVLRGEETACPIWSWKGEDSEFLAQGYRTSPRYGLTEQQLRERQYRYVNPKCEICAGGDNV